jgi:hypothetical protein
MAKSFLMLHGSNKGCTFTSWTTSGLNVVRLFAMSLMLPIMRMFHPITSLVDDRNWCLILWISLIIFKFSQAFVKTFHKFKGFQIWIFFSLASTVVEFNSCWVQQLLSSTVVEFNSCWVINNSVIFYQIKKAKHMWDPCRRPVAENDGCLILI